MDQFVRMYGSLHSDLQTRLEHGRGHQARLAGLLERYAGDDAGAAEPPFFVELGPGTVLTALATRGVKQGCARAVDDPASLAAFLEDDAPRAILSSRGALLPAARRLKILSVSVP